MIILIMGLPGSGKTTLAKKLVEKLNATHINADEVRKAFDDWDFSPEGRTRQANRMQGLAKLSTNKYTVVDFICPTEKTRSLFDADFIIWMNTIKEGRFDDTNKMFEKPSKFDLELTNFDYIVENILSKI